MNFSESFDDIKNYYDNKNNIDENDAHYEWLTIAKDIYFRTNDLDVPSLRPDMFAGIFEPDKPLRTTIVYADRVKIMKKVLHEVIESNYSTTYESLSAIKNSYEPLVELSKKLNYNRGFIEMIENAMYNAKSFFRDAYYIYTSMNNIFTLCDIDNLKEFFDEESLESETEQKMKKIIANITDRNRRLNKEK